MKFQPHRTGRYYYLKFLRLKGDPYSLARGVGVGIFVGLTPTIPFHTVLTLALALAFRASKVSALLASWAVSNPLTIPPLYYLCWRFGNFLTDGHLSWGTIKGLMEIIMSDVGFRESIAAVGQLGVEAVVVLNLGGLLMALPAALVGYVAAFRFFVTLERKRRDKHLLKERREG